MSKTLNSGQVGQLRNAMMARAQQLRQEIRQTLVKTDSEQYLQIADQVRDLEDESFADLMVDVADDGVDVWCVHRGSFRWWCQFSR